MLINFDCCVKRYLSEAEKFNHDIMNLFTGECRLQEFGHRNECDKIELECYLFYGELLFFREIICLYKQSTG